MATSDSDFDLAARVAHVQPLVTVERKGPAGPHGAHVIDMQNDFIAPSGLVGRSGRDVSEAQKKLAERQPKFIAARDAGDLRGVRPQRLFDGSKLLPVRCMAGAGGAQTIRRLHPIPRFGSSVTTYPGYLGTTAVTSISSSIPWIARPLITRNVFIGIGPLA
jgi:hypothetical protein